MAYELRPLTSQSTCPLPTGSTAQQGNCYGGPGRAIFNAERLSRKERNPMQIIGVVASAVVVAGVLLGTAVALKSIPDIQHYRRIRNM